MGIREILSSEGLTHNKVGAQDELKAQFSRALRDMIQEAGLPSYDLRELMAMFESKGQAELAAEVPPGFGSLFSKLSIELKVKTSEQGMYGTLDWRYTHPGGGYNGVSIGNVSAVSDTLESGWRLATGKSKRFSAPRFPSDPF